MAKARKIEPRTEDFIAAYKRLDQDKLLPSNVDLAGIIGVGKSTITEILGRRQNIQPEGWEKFKKHFGLNGNTEISVSHEKRSLEKLFEEPPVEYLIRTKTDPLAIIASLEQTNKKLVDHAETLARQGERLTINNENLVNKALVSLTEILKASSLSQAKDKKQRHAFQQDDPLPIETEGKLKIHSSLKKARKKGSVSGLGR